MQHLKLDQLFALFAVWSSARDRCANPKNPSFKNFGGRGITMCNRWLGSFDVFVADMGARPEGMRIHRIDVNGDYSPENCKWVDLPTSARNRRTTKLSVADVLTLVECVRSGMAPEGIAVAYGVTSAYVRKLAAEARVALPKRSRVAKLNWAQVDEIRALSAQGATGSSLAKRFGVGNTNISTILSGKTWKGPR